MDVLLKVMEQDFSLYEDSEFVYAVKDRQLITIIPLADDIVSSFFKKKK